MARVVAVGHRRGDRLGRGGRRRAGARGQRSHGLRVSRVRICLLAAGVFAAAALRRRKVERALERGEWAGVGERGVLALTLVGMALALGTLAVIVIQA
jgi:uncharacterized membrane protein YidH (DUF202 family)